VPDQYSRVCPASRLWRLRRGPLSATAVGGERTHLSLCYGDVELRALNVAETFYNTSTFHTDGFETMPGGVRLTHRGRADRQRQFDLPLGRPVPVGAFYQVQAERRHLSLPCFDIVLEISEAEGGLDLLLASIDAPDRVPFQLEFCFVGPGQWETADQVVEVANGQTALLTAGWGLFRRGADAIRVGPGAKAHRLWHMRGAEAQPDCFRVLVALETPVEHRLELRCGTWSPATGELVRPPAPPAPT
jgi:hypothetical protein